MRAHQHRRRVRLFLFILSLSLFIFGLRVGVIWRSTATKVEKYSAVESEQLGVHTAIREVGVSRGIESPKRLSLARSRHHVPNLFSHHHTFHHLAHSLPYRSIGPGSSSTLASSRGPLRPAHQSFRRVDGLATSNISNSPPTPLLSSPAPLSPGFTTHSQIPGDNKSEEFRGGVLFATFATISMREFLLNWVAGVRSIGIGALKTT